MSARQFVVLGLGSFGTALARRLSANHCRVTGVDLREKAVEDVKNDLYAAIVADVTDRQALEELLLHQADTVFISLGEQIERSILAALHAKDLGARRIYAKGVTREHGRILEKLGVERVIFPEMEMAVQIADKVTWPNVLDRLPIDPEYGLMEIAVPNHLVGKTLTQANLRRNYGVLVVAVKDALHGFLETAPGADFRLSDDQILLVIGKQTALDEFRGSA